RWFRFELCRLGARGFRPDRAAHPRRCAPQGRALGDRRAASVASGERPRPPAREPPPSRRRDHIFARCGGARPFSTDEGRRVMASAVATTLNARLERAAYWLAVAIVVSLPYSVSATSILVPVWIAVLAPTLSLRDLKDELRAAR